MKKRLLSAIIALLTLAAILLPTPFGLLQEAEAAGTYAYNPTVAANWAADSKNYKNSKNGACATFVSKALEAGGIKDVSNSWAPTLVKNLKNKKYGVEITATKENLNKIKPGDVIAIYSTSVEHVMIVTKVTYNSNGSVSKITFSQRAKSASKCYSREVTPAKLSIWHTYWKNKNNKVIGKKTTFISMYDAVPTTSTVSFNANGGTVSQDSKQVTSSKTYGTLPTPTCNGYEFTGWYDAASGGSLVNASTTVTKTTDHTLYAHWALSSYLKKCTEYPTHGRVETVSQTYLKTLPCSKDTDSNSTDVAVLPAGVSLEPIAIYKNSAGNYWYKVIYNGTTCYLYSGDTKWKNWLGTDITLVNPTTPKSLTQGKAFDIKGTVTAKYNQLSGVYAYVYKGTATSGTASTSSSATGLATKQYSIFNSPVNRNLKFGSLAAGEYSYVLKVHCAYNYCEDGKTLVSRGTGAQYLVHSNGFVVVKSGSTTSYITVSFEVNENDTTVSPTSKQVVVGQTYGELPTPNLAYYLVDDVHFAGWWDDDDNEILPDTKVTITTNHTLHAQWEREEYPDVSVTYDPNGGYFCEHYQSSSLRPKENTASYQTVYCGTYGDSDNASDNYRWPYDNLNTVLCRPGYLFDGWYTEKAGGEQIRVDDVCLTSENHTLYAHWYPDPGYKIYFNATGGTVATESKVVTYGSAYGDLPTPTREGFVFDGWFTKESGGEKVTPSSTVAIQYTTDPYLETDFSVEGDFERIYGHRLFAHWSTPGSTTPASSSEPVTVKRVQVKKSVKLQVPKVKGNTYQWYFRTSKNAVWQSMGKKGAGKVKLSVKITMAMDGWQYRCQVTSASGISYSDIYELYVYEPLKVRKQPKWNQKSLPGTKMTLSITAQGADSYQWLTRPNSGAAWTAIDGATGTSYVVDVQEGMAGRQYACQITGRAGTVRSKSAIVKLAPWPKVKITKQPMWKNAVQPGNVVTLSVKALNAETYQWYYRTSSNGAWIIYSGATQPILTFTVGAGTNGYQYKCTAKGRGGSVDSKPVILKVLAP